MSATLALDQMIGDDGMNADRFGREDCRWIICFHTVDTRGRHIGHNAIQAGIPARIRSRNYPHRNDDVSKPIDEDVPPVVMGRVLAGPAAENLHADFGNRGLRIIECLTGRQTDQDVRFVSDLMAAVLPDLTAFDGEANSEWDVWARRADWLKARRAEYEDGSTEARFIDTLIESNEVGWQFEAEYFDRLEQEATNRRVHGVSAGGRTKLKGGEESRLARLGRRPSTSFDGFTTTPEAGGVPSGLMEVMAQQTEILKAALASKDDTIAALMSRLDALEARSAQGGQQNPNRNRDRG